MTYKKATLLLLTTLSSSTTFPCVDLSWFKRDKIINSLYASAYGDALGRVTEFIPTTEGIFNKYPNGVSSFDDFTKEDWQGIPEMYTHSEKAPYTDDTAMALLVTEVLIQSQKEQWDLNKTMSEIAYSFIKDKGNIAYGWAAPFRAPGNACLKGVLTLEQRLAHINPSKDWWNVEATQAGGCGSVMRAFPFGLVFHDDSEKAKLWAVEHSKLTHGHPIALAACAAMAVGTTACVNNRRIRKGGYIIKGGCIIKDTPQPIIEKMMLAALDYDAGTAQKIRKALNYAKEAKALLNKSGDTIQQALKNPSFRAFHDKVFAEFPGWAADDAIAATVYVFALFPTDLESTLYVGVHTPGDSDSIAAMSGALVGAYHGGISESNIAKLEDSDRINSLANSIHVKSNRPHYPDIPRDC